jgi:hypothetical protein
MNAEIVQRFPLFLVAYDEDGEPLGTANVKDDDEAVMLGHTWLNDSVMIDRVKTWKATRGGFEEVSDLRRFVL